MGKYYRSVQEIERKNPDYKYVVEIQTSGGWFGGYNVVVQGYAKNDPNVDDNANYVSEWFWRRPRREKLLELVDRLHFSVRSAMDERDWDALDQAEMQAKMEELRKRLQEKFDTELERQLRELEKRIRKEQEADKPKP